MSPEDADGMANSVDTDMTAVWPGSTLFAKAYLPKNLGSLIMNLIFWRSSGDEASGGS